MMFVVKVSVLSLLGEMFIEFVLNENVSCILLSRLIGMIYFLCRLNFDVLFLIILMFVFLVLRL